MSKTIKEMLESASAGSTVVLEKGSYDEIVTAPVGRTLTLDLNGSEWTCKSGETPLTVPSGADLKVVNGTISAIKNACVRVGDANATVRASLHLGAGLKLVNTEWCAVFVSAKADLVTEADIFADGDEPCCIQGNGLPEYFGNTCRIIGGHLKATDGNGRSTAIYWPQQGDLVIEGGLIEGDTAVELRAGTLTVTGGRINSTGGAYSVAANGNGSTTFGAAIAIAQHTTKLPIAVRITGGEFTGQVAFSEANPQNNPVEATSKISASIKGGTFTGGIAAIKSADLKNIVYGGTYNQPVDSEYLAVGVRPFTDGTTWTFWYPSDGAEATELSSVLIDGEAVTTLQGTLIGAVESLPSVTANGLSAGTVLYDRSDRRFYRFDGTKWVVEDFDISDDAIDQEHMDSTRPVQTKAVYRFKKETEAALDDRYTKRETNERLDKKQDRITGAASSVVSANLDAGLVLVSDSGGKISQSKVDNATLEHIAGLTIDINDALAAKKDKAEADTEHEFLANELTAHEKKAEVEFANRYTKSEVDEKLLKKQDVLVAADKTIVIEDGYRIRAEIPEITIDKEIKDSPNSIANSAVYNERKRVDAELDKKLAKTDAEEIYLTKDDAKETYVTKADIEKDLSKVLVYKTTVDDFESLPEDNQVGDVYNVLKGFTLDGDHYSAGTNVAWNGTGWDPLGGTFDVSALQTKMVTFTGTVGDWTDATDAEGFAYKGYVAKEGVKEADSATVVFSIADAVSGDYAPVCETAEGKVYVYSKAKGSPTVTVVVQKG